MRVKRLAQEHNAVPRPGLEPEPPNPESRVQRHLCVIRMQNVPIVRFRILGIGLELACNGG